MIFFTELEKNKISYGNTKSIANAILGTKSNAGRIITLLQIISEISSNKNSMKLAQK
jgi:hypothetical protein